MKTLSKSPLRTRAIYEIGGHWGNCVDWNGNTGNRVMGFKKNLPKFGDLLYAPMQSGRVGVFVFTEVRIPGDPPDQFFGTVAMVGYQDDPETSDRLLSFDEHYQK